MRRALVAQQQAMAVQKGFIVDGRDIGTVVLPEAEVKIYLTASAQARALRRTLQNKEKGLPADYAEILKEIKQRDYQDMHRQNSPLRQAEDAVLLDSSSLELEEVVAYILKIIKGKVQEL